ncbi:hypothetical protein Tsumi_01950 [Porphyromonas miyakawae]|uniref:Por secretion system C-terminal sorting domain-containing protein n=1 Tax=Porphyromonas miyakawae TaxID=3137470 RepID=A0ABQ0E055_9PORP
MLKRNFFVYAMMTLLCLAPTVLRAQVEWDVISVSSTSLLPSATVYAVASVEDNADGSFTVLIGTPKGACMLSDGKRYEVPGLEKEKVVKILIDSKEKVWFCTEDNGLIKVDPGHDNIHYTNAEGQLVDLLVQDIVEDEKGGFYIANGNAVSYLDNKGKFVTYQLTANPMSLMFCLTYDKGSQTVYVGSEAGIYSLKDGKAQAIESTAAYGSVHQMLFHDGKLWAATETGVACYDGTTWKMIEGLPYEYFTTIAVSKEGDIWVGSDDGAIVVLNAADGLVKQTYKTEHGLPASSLYSLTFGSAGHAFVGTQGAGFLYYKDGKWTQISPEGLLSDNVRSVYLDEVENVAWIGTAEGVSSAQLTEQADSEDSFKWQNYTPENSNVAGRNARRVCSDMLGDTWVAFFDGGISFFNPATKKWTSYTPDKNTFPHKMATDILISSQGETIATTFGGGYAKFIGGKWVPYTEKEGVPTNSIFGVTESADKTLWFASVKGAFSLKNGVYTSYTKASHALPDDNVRVVFCAPNGNIYFGTNAGLAIAPEGNLSAPFVCPKALQGKMVNHIAMDKNGNLLLSCLNDGLYIYAANGVTAKVDASVGFEANEARMCYIDNDGVLTVCTEKGLYITGLEDIIKVLEAPVIEKESVVVYPNPASNLFSFGKCVKRVSLCTLRGETLRTATNVSQLYVGDIAEGMYILTLDGENAKVTIRR